MSSDIIEIQQRLGAIAAKLQPNRPVVENLRRLSAGASQETWSFDIDGGVYILRRAPNGQEEDRPSHALSLAVEAEVIQAVAKHGAPAPNVFYVCDEDDDLGQAFIMERMDGETLARKILRDDAFADARRTLAYECGAALAKIHQTPIDEVSSLERSGAVGQLDVYEQILREFEPRPILELAFRHLRDNAPQPAAPVLVHGDFRNGNLMVGTDGLRGVLDWELAHIGDPREDFGWICVNSWRYGETHAPVGGFGQKEQMLQGYVAHGGEAFSLDDIQYWEMLGTLKWGVMCLIMYDTYKSGRDPSVERAAIGRRASEAEMDLINMFEEMVPANA